MNGCKNAIDLFSYRSKRHFFFATCINATRTFVFGELETECNFRLDFEEVLALSFSLIESLSDLKTFTARFKFPTRTLIGH